MLRTTFVLAIVVIASAPRIAEACSCIRPAAPRVELERAALVFVGTVTEVTQPEDDPAVDKTVSFEPSSILKGPAPSPLVLTTAGNSAACGYGFEVGNEYLVYADAQRRVSLCSRTALYRRAGGEPIGEVAAEITELQPAEPPPPATTPQRRGCAGCSSGAGGSSALALLALLLARVRRT